MGGTPVAEGVFVLPAVLLARGAEIDVGVDRVRAAILDRAPEDRAVWPGDQASALELQPAFGARPPRRTIQREVDNRLSAMLLDVRLGPGQHVTVAREDDALAFVTYTEPAGEGSRRTSKGA